jgi:hypothetical protein
VASWSDAAPALEPAPRSRRRPPPAPRRSARKRRRPALAGGVVWIALLAVLLSGIVALNVAVLRLNVQLNRKDAERTKLYADKQALASQLSLAAASPRLQALARQAGLVPADPTQTTYVRLRPGHSR